MVLKDYDGREIIIDDVLYVPGLKTNLTSLGQLVHKGFAMEMKENGLSIFDKDQKLVIHANLSENRTFRVGMVTRNHQCFATEDNRNE